MSAGRPVSRAALQAAGRAFGLLLQTVTFGLLAHRMDAPLFAAFSAALALHLIGAALGEFGLTQTLVLRLGEDVPDRDVLAEGADATVRLTVAALAVTGVLAVVLLDGDARTAFVWLLPWFVVSRARVPLLALHQYHLRTVRQVGADIAGRSLTLAGAAFLTTKNTAGGIDLRWLALAFAAGEVVTLVFLAREVPARSSGARRGAGWPVIRRAVPIGLTAAASMIHARVDQTLLAKFGTAEELARYAVSYRILDASGALTFAVSAVTFPLLVRSRRAGADRVATVLPAVAAALAVVAGMSVFVASPVLVRVVGGARYEDASGLLRLLAPVVAIALVNSAVAQVAIVRERSAQLLRVAVCMVVLNTAGNLVLIPQFGDRGAAAATCATELLGAALVIAVSFASDPDARRTVFGLLAAVVLPFAGYRVGAVHDASTAWFAFAAAGGVAGLLVTSAVRRTLGDAPPARPALTVR